MEHILQAKKEENNSFLEQWNLKNNERNHLYGNWHTGTQSTRGQISL
jgi:hypothetical protein